MKKFDSATTQAHPLTLQDKMDHSLHLVGCMTEKFVQFDNQDFSHRPKPNMDDPYILHDSNLPSFDRQPLTQAQMREACESIHARVQQDSWSNQGVDVNLCTVINFLDFTQKCGGDTFYLSDTVVCFRGITDQKTLGCGFLEYVRMDARVYIGLYNGKTHAFIEAERATGEYQIAELSEFGLMSSFEADEHIFSVVTFFNKDHDVEKFVITPNSPRKNHWPRTDIPADAVPPVNRGNFVVMGNSYLGSSATDNDTESKND